MRLRYWWALALVALFVSRAQATTVGLDPGAPGTSFTLKQVDFTGVQTSVDVNFTQFLVAPALGVTFYLNQVGGVGDLPSTDYSIDARWINRDGTLGPSFSLFQSVFLPGQIWPGWPFTLDGKPFLPPTLGLSASATGAVLHDALGAYIDPFVVTGIHFDITGDLNNVIGGRFSIYPIGLNSLGLPRKYDVLVAPAKIPRYSAELPESSPVTLLSVGLSLLVLIRRRLSQIRA